GDGDAAWRSLRAQPRSSSLQPRRSARAADGRRLHDRAAHVYERVAVSADGGGAAAAARPRTARRARRAAGNLGAAGTGERAALRPAARGERLDSPLRRARRQFAALPGAKTGPPTPVPDRYEIGLTSQVKIRSPRWRRSGLRRSQPRSAGTYT